MVGPGDRVARLPLMHYGISDQDVMAPTPILQENEEAGNLAAIRHIKFFCVKSEIIIVPWQNLPGLLMY